MLNVMKRSTPAFCALANFLILRFHVDGKTLTLQQVRNARGVTVTQATVLKFIRVE